MAREDVDKKTEKEARCGCPYCEGAVQIAAPWCVSCGVEVRFCVACEEPLPKEATVCPNCGAEAAE